VGEPGEAGDGRDASFLSGLFDTDASLLEGTGKGVMSIKNLDKVLSELANELASMMV